MKPRVEGSLEALGTAGSGCGCGSESRRELWCAAAQGGLEAAWPLRQGGQSQPVEPRAGGRVSASGISAFPTVPLSPVTGDSRCRGSSEKRPEVSALCSPAAHLRGPHVPAPQHKDVQRSKEISLQLQAQPKRHDLGELRTEAPVVGHFLNEKTLEKAGLLWGTVGHLGKPAKGPEEKGRIRGKECVQWEEN